MNKLQLLTDRICELIPDIRMQGDFIHALRQYTILEDWANDCPDEQVLEEAFCISAGIPTITLADVLLALKKSDEDYPIHIDFFFDDGDSVTITQAKGHPIINKKGTWNLTKNTLHEQDEETIDFLYSVICK